MKETMKGTTFQVSNVKQSRKRLPGFPCHEFLSGMGYGPIEACSNYHGQLIANVISHPLIAALHGAFCLHLPLVLSPDIIWLTITQGLARHINANAEELRKQFVSHQGKLKISVRRDDFVKGSAENPWPKAFSTFSEKVHEHIGDVHELIVSDFSTTGPVEKAASEIVLLDSVQSYFNFEMVTICGIPSIALEGTIDDWRKIALHAEQLSDYGLKWWICSLLPVLNQFVEAASGNIDREFWDSIYKWEGPKGSGSPSVTGWVLDLFPYLYNLGNYVPNPLLHKRLFKRLSRQEQAFLPLTPTREAFPYSVSTVPFDWVYIPHNTTYKMEFIGGLIGVSQDEETLSLRPELGWAVRDTECSQDLTQSDQLVDDPW